MCPVKLSSIGLMLFKVRSSRQFAIRVGQPYWGFPDTTKNPNDYVTSAHSRPQSGMSKTLVLCGYSGLRFNIGVVLEPFIGSGEKVLQFLLQSELIVVDYYVWKKNVCCRIGAWPNQSSGAVAHVESLHPSRSEPMRHGCNYNPQQTDKICFLWFHIGWIIYNMFIVIPIMFVYIFHCLPHCMGIILIPWSNPLFWFCL